MTGHQHPLPHVASMTLGLGAAVLLSGSLPAAAVFDIGANEIQFPNLLLPLVWL